MTKYNEQFKLQVVEKYLSGTVGYKSLSGPLGLDHKMVKRWVDLHRLHGISGLTKKFNHYSAEFKVSVLEHMWVQELSYSQAAAAFNIRSPGCVGQWERCYHSGGIDALRPRARGRPKNMPNPPLPESPEPTSDDNRTREDLLAEVDHLRMENAYLKKLRALVQTQQQAHATARKKRK